MVQEDMVHKKPAAEGIKVPHKVCQTRSYIACLSCLKVGARDLMA